MSAVEGGTRDLERLRALARILAERNGQLERALQSRIVIEQAKGVLMERFQLDPPEAFELLRQAARSHRIKIAELAMRVVAERVTPPEIRRALKPGTTPAPSLRPGA
jgi:AmiR/NasT family two-component response regulator